MQKHLFLASIIVLVIGTTLILSMPVFRVSARCPNGTHKSPSGVCEQVVPREGLPRCPNGFHRSPSGFCESVNGISGPESNYPSNKTVVPKRISASRLYIEQYGRYSLQVPNDWTTGSPTIKQDSLTNSFSPKNGDDILFIVTVSDRHAVVSESDYEQIIRDENTGTIADTPGATLLQATDCTKYVIDGNQACSMIYTVTENQYTTKELDISFHTAKQEVFVSLQGSAFDRYLPIAEQMLNSMKLP
jgi:hypothetical protein